MLEFILLQHLFYFNAHETAALGELVSDWLISVFVGCVVTEPYTVREARIHVRHVRDLLKSVGLQDAYASVDCNSLSLLNIITAGNILGQF